MEDREQRARGHAFEERKRDFSRGIELCFKAQRRDFVSLIINRILSAPFSGYLVFPTSISASLPCISLARARRCCRAAHNIVNFALFTSRVN